MVKAMYSGVAGLKAHQSKMDVIGNNIANVNTWGYKSMDTSFKESIYSMITESSGGSTSNGGYGGVNPSVVGYGSMVSAISANFTSGNQVPTGKNLDLYIDGTAFFAVGPMYGEGEAKSPSDVFLSRVGDFNVVNGYLVDGNGRYVYGSTMAKGGEVHNPSPTIEETSKNVQLGLPSSALKFSGRSAKYTEHNNVGCAAGQMNSYVYKASSYTSIDPTGEGDLMDFIPNPPSPITADDIRKAVENFNGETAGTTRYAVDPTNNMKVIRVDLATESMDPATDTGVITDLGPVPSGGWTRDTLKTAVDNFNLRATGNGKRYMINPNDPSKVIALNPAASEDPYDATGTLHELYPRLIAKDLETAVKAYNEDMRGELQDATNKFRYAIDPNNPTKVIKMERVDDLSQTKVEIPLPDTKVTKDPDGKTITISYEATGTPGEAKETTKTVTPPDEDSVSDGPQFDDGRFEFDPETGSYTMTDNVSTLAPLKIPTTCTYYDKDGNPQIEDNVVFSTFTVKKDGMIYGTSEKTKELYLVGSVGLVNVSNPGGMTKSDGPYYQLSEASGDGNIIQPGGMTGSLTSGYLESANVDIATEFSSMITTERGFQANSKIITVTDEMLQELVNMKR